MKEKERLKSEMKERMIEERRQQAERLKRSIEEAKKKQEEQNQKKIVSVKNNALKNKLEKSLILLLKADKNSSRENYKDKIEHEKSVAYGNAALVLI